DPRQARAMRQYGFLDVETSPGSRQVWLAVDGGTKELARRLKRGIGADPGASGAVRLAGSRNFKNCHAPNFPMVRVVWCNTERPFVAAEVLESSGLVADAMDPCADLSRVVVSRPPNAWPSYQRCLDDAPRSRTHDGPDVSIADFCFARIALQRYRWIKQP